MLLSGSYADILGLPAVIYQPTVSSFFIHNNNVHLVPNVRQMHVEWNHGGGLTALSGLCGADEDTDEWQFEPGSSDVASA